MPLILQTYHVVLSQLQQLQSGVSLLEIKRYERSLSSGSWTFMASLLTYIQCKSYGTLNMYLCIRPSVLVSSLTLDIAEWQCEGHQCKGETLPQPSASPLWVLQGEISSHQAKNSLLYPRTTELFTPFLLSFLISFYLQESRPFVRSSQRRF